MTTIKMNKDGFTPTIEKLSQKVTAYTDSVTSSIAQFGELQGGLEGEAYSSLIKKINEELNQQKTLVAECVVLSDNAKKFAEDLSAAEDSVSFG